MKSLCVITIKLNTLTDVPYQMTVGGAFVYVCERGHVTLKILNGRVYITRYNGVAVYITPQIFFTTSIRLVICLTMKFCNLLTAAMEGLLASPAGG